MRRKSLEKANCPIARSLERVGEWWSILILRDALHGYTRFEEFRESLGVAPNILTTRLAALVESGFLERRQYSAHPPRYEYVPTARGREIYLTCCWLETLCTAEVRVLGWVYQARFGRAFHPNNF